MYTKNKFIYMLTCPLAPIASLKDIYSGFTESENVEAGASRRFTPDESAIANLNAPRSYRFYNLPRIH